MTAGLQEMRDQRWSRALLEAVGREIRMAQRGLRKSPTYAAACIGSLGLSIGATVAVFAIVELFLLRPPPWRRPDEVFLLRRVDGRTGISQSTWSQRRFTDVQLVTQGSIPAVANFASRAVTLAAPAGDSGVRAEAEFVSASYFRLVGTAPARGVTFAEQAESPDPATAIMSSRLATRLFGGEALGRTLRANGVSLTIIGVMPAGFVGLSGRGDIFIPVEGAPAVWAQPGALTDLSWVYAIALRVPRERTAGERQGITDRLSRVLSPGGAAVAAGPGPATASASVTRLVLTSAADALVEPGTRNLLWVLLGAAACVLGLASANVASLSAARFSARAAEMSVRAALGASAFRLMLSVLAEACLVGGLGGALGLLLSSWAGHAMWALRPAMANAVAQHVGDTAPSVLTVRTVGFTAATTAVAVVVIGLWPVLEIRRRARGPSATFTEAARGSSTGGPGMRRLRESLAAVQFGLAIIVTIAALEFVGSFRSLARLDYGVSSTGVVTLRLDLPRGRYDAPTANALYQSLVDYVSRIPGVQAAAVANGAPLDANVSVTAATVDQSLPDGSGGRGTELEYHVVGAGYFRSVGARTSPDLAGRGDAGAPTVPVVVSRSAARQFWPGRNPVGLSIHEMLLPELARRWARGEIMGIAPDIQYGTVGAPPRPAVYVSLADDPPSRAVLIVRASVDAEALLPQVRAVLRALDPQLVFYAPKTLEAREREISSATRFASVVLGTYASVALAIAIVGVYSVLAFSVTQRRKEIGIRVALGATPTAVLWTVMSGGTRAISVGVVLGLVASSAFGRVLRSQLLAIHTNDPGLYGAVLAGFLVAGVLACLLPALRALKVDTALLLRSE
jgi:predicted permease